MCRAVNLVIREKVELAAWTVRSTRAIFRAGAALPVAGLMSAADAYDTAKQYTAIDAMAKSLGSTLAAPFMTLSFMALLVIPHLKLSDRGLFDGDEFRFYGDPAVSYQLSAPSRNKVPHCFPLL
jgi:adenine deaminase